MRGEVVTGFSSVIDLSCIIVIAALGTQGQTTSIKYQMMEDHLDYILLLPRTR